MTRCRIFFFFFIFYLLSLHNPRCGLYPLVIVIIFPSNVLRFIPTGKSYPPLRQEMQDAFRPEHMRQEAECARVDFPCPSLEQDLKDGKMMTMTYTLSTAGFLHCSTGTASATSILPQLSKAGCQATLSLNRMVSLASATRYPLSKIYSIIRLTFWRLSNHCFVHNLR